MLILCSFFIHMFVCYFPSFSAIFFIFFFFSSSFESSSSLWGIAYLLDDFSMFSTLYAYLIYQGARTIKLEIELCLLSKA